MIETLCRILEMPLKDDKEAENIVVKNEDIHENDVLMGRGKTCFLRLLMPAVKAVTFVANSLLLLHLCQFATKGGKNNRHIGNEKLRDIARGQVEKYKVSTKKIKSAISRDIVKQVRNLDPPGRFLKRVAETGEWEGKKLLCEYNILDNTTHRISASPKFSCALLL